MPRNHYSTGIPEAALGLLIALALFTGCDTRQQAKFQQRKENSTSFYKAKVKNRFDQLVHAHLLKDIRSGPLSPGMQPFLSIALFERKDTSTRIWAFWLSDQPAANAIGIRVGDRHIEVPISTAQQKYNDDLATDGVDYAAWIPVDPHSDVQRLINSAPQLTNVEIYLISPNFGHSNTVPLTPAPPESSTTTPGTKSPSQ